MAKAAVHSKAVVMLLLPLCAGWAGFCVGPCFVIHNLVSFLVCRHIDKEWNVGYFTLIDFLMSCALGWSEVCDCGIT